MSERYRKGYDYATKAIATGVSTTHLRGHVECSKEFGDYDSFDEGIEAAVVSHEKRMKNLVTKVVIGYQMRKGTLGKIALLLARNMIRATHEVRGNKGTFTISHEANPGRAKDINAVKWAIKARVPQVLITEE